MIVIVQLFRTQLRRLDVQCKLLDGSSSLQVEESGKNLVRFFSAVGFRYNATKQRSSDLVAEWLRCIAGDAVESFDSFCSRCLPLDSDSTLGVNFCFLRLVSSRVDARTRVRFHHLFLTALLRR